MKRRQENGRNRREGNEKEKIRMSKVKEIAGESDRMKIKSSGKRKKERKRRKKKLKKKDERKKLEK